MDQLLAFAVLADLWFGLWEAGAIFALFVLQFPFPTIEVRLVSSAAYPVLAVALLVRRRRWLPPILASVARWGDEERGGRGASPATD